MVQDDCIFCKIVAGKIPSAKVYEDDELLAFLDLAPLNPGHTILTPKTHFKNLLETPDSLAPSVHRALQAIGRGVMSATGAQGFNVLQNNNPVAGQTVFHIHWHVIPRHENDGAVSFVQGSYADQDEMRDLAGRIASRIQA